MQLKRVGFFRELGHGLPTGPSLIAAMSQQASVDEAKIVKYLRNGVPCVMTMSFVNDVIDPSKGTIGELYIMTDGVWEWPSDLSHYVYHYHVRLEKEFIDHMRQNNWKVPDESQLDLENLEY